MAIAAAATVAVSAAAGLVLKVADNEHLDPTPMAYWGPATVALGGAG